MKEVDLSKYRDCSGMGLSGSIADSFGVVRRDGKSWCPAARFDELKKLMAGIRADLKEEVDRLLESPDGAEVPPGYQHVDAKGEEDWRLKYYDENAYPFMVVWRDMRCNASTSSSKSLPLMLRPPHTRQYAEDGQQTDSYKPLLLVGKKKEKHCDIADRFGVPFRDRGLAAIAGRVWDFKGPTKGPLVSFWNREDKVREYWEYVKKLLRDRIHISKFQFGDDDSDTWRDYQNVKPGTAVSAPKLSDEEVKELMKKQHLDPNAKRILKRQQDVQVEPKLAGYPTAAQYNFAKTIGDSVEDRADKLLESPLH